MTIDIVFPELTPRQQAEALKETEHSCRTAPAKEGDKVYLISNKWFGQWCQHTGFTIGSKGRVTVSDLAQPGPRPGSIDSSDLLADSLPKGAGRDPDLNEEERFRILRIRDPLPLTAFFEAREPTYQLLKQWYGVSGPEVWVELMQVGPARRIETELHPWYLKAVLEASEAEHNNRSAVVAVSKQCTVTDLKRRCCAALGVKESDYEIMDFSGMEKAKKLEQHSYRTLVGAHLVDQQAVLLRHTDRVREMEEEEKAEAGAGGPLPSTSPPLQLMSTSPGLQGSSPVPSSPLSRSLSKPPSWAEDIIQTSASRRRGLAGLGNLGNTCFMNSSVQCLAHTVPVMETFLGGTYKADINIDNPLGMGGKLASAFGSLMERLWQGGVSSVSPKRFKWQLARFAPQFQGYSQQDSQELLAFLLDGLHEDLNRIKNKPYIEEKDDDGRPDAEMAQEAWTNYRARNDSVIVDNFQGLYKSTLVCPRCKNKSRKFDPFMYLSLPLPTAKTRAFNITLVHVDGSEPPLQFNVEVPKTSTLRQLCTALGRLCGVESEGDAERMLLLVHQSGGLYGTPKTEVLTDLQARVSIIKEPSRGIFSSSKSTLLAYRYPDADSGPLSGKKEVIVLHKARGSSVAASTPLFLSDEELQSLVLEPARPTSSFSSQQEWAVKGPGSVLDLAMRRLLRPFMRHQVELFESLPVAATPDEHMNSPTAAEPTDGQTAAGIDEDIDAMELEQPDTPPAEGLTDASPSSSSSDVGMDQVAPASMGPQLPSASADEPFNMWPQQAAAAASVPAGEVAAAAAQQLKQQQQRAYLKEPYQLKLSMGPDCKPRVVVSEMESPPNLATEELPLYFVADWSSEGAGEYNLQLLDRPPKHQSVLDAEAAAAHGSKPVSLAECMETFLQPEQLDAEDSWYCSQCKDHVQADKKLDLWTLPEVLVVHLKRFSYSRYSRDKLDTKVDFPLEGLDLTRYLLQGQGAAHCRYDLYAVSNHYGGLGGGHYTAYCKMPDDGRWYLFDDSSVRDTEEASVVSSAAYVLFYRREGSKVDLATLLSQHKHDAGLAVGRHDEAMVAEPSEPEVQFSIGSL